MESLDLEIQKARVELDNLVIKKKEKEAETRELGYKITKAEDKLNTKIQNKRRAKKRQIDFESFLERPEDAIIGRAHYDYNRRDYSTYGTLENNKITKFERHSPFVIIVKDGVRGDEKRYYSPMELSHTSLNVFHKVWTEKQRTAFKRKVNKLVRDEIKKILEDDFIVIELLGAANTQGHGAFPKDKQEIAQKMVREEQYKILDKMDIEKLLKIHQSNKLNFGRGLLATYLIDKNRIKDPNQK